MTGPATLRPGRDGDPDWIIEKHRDWYAAEFGFTPDFGDAIAGRMEEFLSLDDPFKRLWIARDESTRVGSIAISIRPGNAAFLNFVLVDPTCRRQGIARCLMDTALAHARSHRIATLRLMTYSCLTGARKLYAAYGFEIVEITRDIEAHGQVMDQEFWRLRL